MFGGRIFGYLATVFFVLCQGHAYAAESKLRSLYTTLQKCKSVERLQLPERTLGQAKGSGILRCRGINGYSIYVIDDDPRSWLVLERDNRLAPLDRQMVSDFKIGNFPNVAGSKNVEWRVDRHGKAVGLIVRVSYQRSDISANSPASQASALFAFDIRDFPPSLLGIAQNNAEARELLDKALR
ncbi:hypothetical protein QEV83_07515 [Methylocapsa sp. D3K7]|uniref:hypothetical protein n=1 Tax=Methylocapsa sp. D3K7 TaxID=3041435 RepID=UPI00244EE5B2|nr:hypothetical protein [Methylocapsa sp. D3K7]WGJ16081.1 hypothetical protein QEV83_07515 [Methylocapsa sp. D3K7]